MDDDPLWRRIRLPLFALIAIASLLWAFKPEPIRNLRLVSVVSVPPRQIPDKYGLDDIVHTSTAAYRLRLQGSAQWIRRIIARELNVYMIARLCNQRKIEVPVLGPFIGQTPVEPHDPSGALSRLDNNGDTLYDAYIGVSGRFIGENDVNADIGGYDLHKSGLTLCVQIAGGSMYGAYAASNVVRIVLPPPPHP